MATIRGTGMQASSASSYVVPWPAGTLAGDLAIIMTGHGWVATAPSGWTTNDSQTGLNWNGSVFSKVLTATEITAGSVTVAFSGSFDGTLAIITFVGSSGSTGITVAAIRNGSGVASVPVTATIPATSVDPLIYFGSNRAASTDTVNRGTLQRQVNDGSAASGCLYTETGVTGSVTATFNYSAAGSGNYQAIVILGPPPLALACAGGATLSSAYLVVFLSRKNVLVADLPPFLGSTLTGITTLDGSIANWGIGPSLPLPANGTWSPTVTYAIGNTVASATYAIRTAAGALIAPLTYRSLQSGNMGHDPDDYGGWWTCITQPADATNSNFVPVPFGYSLSPLPTRTMLAAAQWQAGLGHSLSWGPVIQPGDVVQLLDLYVILNYLAGSEIVQVVSRPLNASVAAGTQGQIINKGTNAQFQCWFTSGLSSTPFLTLNAFEPKIVDGMQPDGTVGVAYLSAIVASGGAPPYVYGIISGSLPPGVSLDPATGVISGTPTASGLFEFTAQVTDGAGTTAQTTCAASIACGAGAAANNRFY